MTVPRVYVPSTWSGLGGLRATGALPAPLPAHAVTDALREAYADGGDEEWEYAAAAAAAQASVGLLAASGGSDPARRVVVAVDVPESGVRPLAGEDPTAVEVTGAVPLRRVAAVMVDVPDAEPAVAAAVDAWPAAEAGDADAVARVERCLDHELGWWATQELGPLLDG